MGRGWGLRRGVLIVEGKGGGGGGGRVDSDPRLFFAGAAFVFSTTPFLLQPLSSYNSTSSYKHPFLQLFLFFNTFRSFNFRAPFSRLFFFAFRFSLFAL